MGEPERQVATLTDRVVWIGESDGEGIAEDCGCFLEGYPVLRRFSAAFFGSQSKSISRSYAASRESAQRCGSGTPQWPKATEGTSKRTPLRGVACSHRLGFSPLMAALALSQIPS